MAKDPYADLDPEDKARVELDALPKDANHPFAKMDNKRAKKVLPELVSKRAKNHKKAVQPVTGPDKDRLLEAYAAKVAKDYYAERNPDLAKEFQAQEEALLG